MPDEPIEGVKFSEFPSETPDNADEVVGLHAGDNARFSVANFVLAIRQGLANMFVPLTRTVNSKALSSDITLTASDVGAYQKPSSGIPKTDLAQGVQDSLDDADSAYQMPSGGIPATDMAQGVQNSLGLADMAYQLPNGGIPSSDMASAVQISLGKADTAYQKPSSGIPASDLASGVIPTVPSASTANPAMDGTASPGSSGAWARGDHVHPTDTSRLPVYGKGENLLENSYFVGGGTGRGVFPVNQRGESSYTGLVYGIDRWYSLTTGGTLTIGADYITLQAATYNFNWRQTLSRKVPLGSAVTLTVIKGDGSLVTGSDVLSSSSSFVQVNLSSGYIRAYYDYVQITTGANSSNTIKAIWLELGSEQTFAHQENGTWVLNEIPNYEEELLKCKTSTADPSDIYTNKVIATNISNPNLLRNWYFVGGGTGRGVFPVNQRGVTSGSTTAHAYSADGWEFYYNPSAGTWAMTVAGFKLTPVSNGAAILYQYVYDSLLNGNNLTASILFSNGTFAHGTITRASGTTQQFISGNNLLRLMNTGRFYITVESELTIVAVKLEFGTEQTLAHQENGVWVLNEIPDYEEELIKCKTSTADSNDTFASKSLATEQQLTGNYVEIGTTSSRKYSVGEYFCWNGLLYRVTAAIDSGQLLNPGANCVATTVAGMFTMVTKSFTTNTIGRVTANLNWSQGYIVQAWAAGYEVRVYSSSQSRQGLWVLDLNGNNVASTSVSITYLVYNYTP